MQGSRFWGYVSTGPLLLSSCPTLGARPSWGARGVHVTLSVVPHVSRKMGMLYLSEDCASRKSHKS